MFGIVVDGDKIGTPQTISFVIISLCLLLCYVSFSPQVQYLRASVASRPFIASAKCTTNFVAFSVFLLLFFRHQPKLLRRSEPPFLIPPGGGKIQRLQIDTTCVKPLFFYLYYRLTILALFSSSCYRGKGGSGFGGERSFFLLFVPPTDCRCGFFLGSFRLSGFL